MNKLKTNAFLKVLSCIIFIFSASVCAMSLVGILVAESMGCFVSGEPDYYKTEYFKGFAENQAWFLADSYIDGDYEVESEGIYIKIYDRGYPEGENGSIDKNEEKPIYSNGTAKNAGLSGEITYIDDNGGEYTVEYTAENPLPKESSIYPQSVIYDFLYPICNGLIAYAIISGIISIICFVHLILACGHKKRQRRHCT